MAASRSLMTACGLVATVLLIGVLIPAPLRAQSATRGSLRGLLVVSGGPPVPDAALTLEDEGGGVVRHFKTDRDGQFNLALLNPGTYALLIEKTGFQPFRQRGILIMADMRTEVHVAIIRRPPPIIQVEESDTPDQQFTPATPRVEETLGGPDFATDGARLDLSESGRFASGIVSPSDAAWGLGDVIGSFPQMQSRLSVDGLPVFWMRHPGLSMQPAGNPLVPPYLQEQVRYVQDGSDAELLPAPGGVVDVVTRPTTRSFRFEPFLTLGPGIGVPGALNPAGSGLTSLQIGGVASGTIVKNRAQFLIGGSYESLHLPSAAPWAHDSSSFGGSSVPLAGTLAAIAQDSFGYNAAASTRPPLRTYQGGSGNVQVDWQLSPIHQITARAASSRHTEDRPLVGLDLLTDGGAKLESKDFLGSIALTSTWEDVSNEFRVGYQSADRAWTDASPSTTYIVADQVGLGAAPSLPGHFNRTAFTLLDNVAYQFGSAGENQAKFGLYYSQGTYQQDYVYGSKGIFQFGDLDLFGGGAGSYFAESAANSNVSFKLVDLGVFSHVQMQFTPAFSGLVGIRWDRQKFPSDVLVFDTAFASAFGIKNQWAPDNSLNLSPRLGLNWTGGTNKSWQANFVAAMDRGQLNPALFAEAAMSNRDLTVQREVGTFASWPVGPDAVALPPSGRRFALFNPNPGGYKNPRTGKLDLQVQHTLPGGLIARVSGQYHHTDYLIRRTDLNLLPTPTGFTQEGRPVYGTLVKSGGLIVADPGSNRSLRDYDMVSALSSTSSQDFYEARLELQKALGRGLDFTFTYSYSRTRDNWLQGPSGDPEDELSPFPSDPITGGWAKGVSNFDIPNRLFATATWRSSGRIHVNLYGRYRYRDGLPFTPGFSPGVDVNGDGSGRNDPAYVDPNIPGMPAVVPRFTCLGDQLNRFAGRNSCRDPGVHAFDLGGAVALPVRSLAGGRVEVTLDLINLLSSETGIYDHALVLIDPNGTLVTSGSGNVTLPLLANPDFGKLLSRRDEPRMVRLGLRLGY